MRTLPARRVRRSPADAGPLDLGPCLDGLDRAIEAGRALGLSVADAEAVRDEARERLGIPSDAYVLALVGGTGVGKSSLLNALAGAEVSRASVLRPTTGEPVAWIARDADALVAPILDRLAVGDRRVHDDPAYERVVLLDLPDVDSVEAAHRARVEELLPKVDAVAWVTDPEKYADALLHDEFFATWLPRLARQVVLLNKVDRLLPTDARKLQADLERRLAPLSRGGRARVLRTSAIDPTGTVALQDWLDEAVDAKRVVVARLGAATRGAVSELAAAAGVDPSGPPKPLLDVLERRRLIDDTAAAALRLIDIDGAQRQAVAATRALARRKGTGPFGVLTSFVYRASGRQRRVADPGTHLSRWRERGPLERISEPIHGAVMATIPAVPGPLRPSIAASADRSVLGRRLGDAIDKAMPASGSLQPPSSRLWPLLGLLQTANLFVTIAAAVWVVTWVLLRPPTDSITLPVIGPVPAPLVLLGAALLVGYLLARVVGWHAGWRGRRWARSVTGGLHTGITGAVETEAFAPLDQLDADRRRLWQAARAVSSGCG
jgi:hypothetical protein